jgi:hypothetical protein
MRAAVPRLRFPGLWLVGCALALRLIVAPGFMPMTAAGGMTVSMCTGQGPVDVRIPGDPKPSTPSDCAFGALASVAALDAPLAIVAVPAALYSPVRSADPARFPHVAAPAPPPPSTGPPRLA